MTPYEVFFFSSARSRSGWTTKDLNLNRANVYIGFPLGGLLSLSIMTSADLILAPAGIDVGQLSQVALPVAVGARPRRARRCVLVGHLRRDVRRGPRDRALGRLHRRRSTWAGSGASTCRPRQAAALPPRRAAVDRRAR